MEEELKSIKLSVHGLLTANKSGISAAEIGDLYKMLLGSEPPFRKFNCRNLEEFISKHMSDDAYCRSVDGKRVFLPVMKEESKHVAMLINRTKDSKKPKKVVHKVTGSHAKKPMPPRFAAEKKPPMNIRVNPVNERKPPSRFSGKPMPPRFEAEKKPAALMNIRVNPVNEMRPAPRDERPESRSSSYYDGERSNHFANERRPFANGYARGEDKQNHIPNGRARGSGRHEAPNQFHDNPRMSERMRYDGDSVRHRESKYDDAKKFKSFQPFEGDAFRESEDSEVDRLQIRRPVTGVNKPHDARNDFHPHPEFPRSPSPSNYNGSQHYTRDFSNLTISVPTNNSRERVVVLGDGSGKQGFNNDLIRKGSLPSSNHFNSARGNPSSFERSANLNDYGQNRVGASGCGDFNEDLRNYMKDFNSLTISMPMGNSKERFVADGLGYDPIKKGSLPYLSSTNHVARGNPPPFERSISLNEHGQMRSSVSGSGDYNEDLRSHAGSRASDRTTTMSNLKSGSINLYSPMNSPIEEKSRAMTPQFSPFEMKVGKTWDEIKASAGNFSRQSSDSGGASKVNSQISPPTQHFKPSTPTHSTMRIFEDPSIIPPVTSPSKPPAHFSFADTSKTIAFSSPLSQVQVSGSTSDMKLSFLPITTGSNTHTSPPVQQTQSKDDGGDSQMIIVTEVHTTSLVLGHFKCSGDPVSFALTNLEDISEVDLEYVRILLLNRCFRAAFDYNSSKCYGTLYKKNGLVWINMNLFILEETLDPVFVRKDPQSLPTYTVSELFSIRKRSKCYKNPELTGAIQEPGVVSTDLPTDVDNVERKLAILHSWDDNGKIWLDFLSLDEDNESGTPSKKDSKPIRQSADGKTRVGCFLRGFAEHEVEWTSSKLMKMREVLRAGSKVLVKIFERRYCCDQNAFSIDLRLLGQCSFITDVFKRDPSSCPLWKVAQVDMPAKGERIFVTKVRSLQHCNAIRLKYFDSFGKMLSEMQEFYDQQKEDVCVDEAIIKQYLYCFKSKEDDLWYRGRVEDFKEDSKVLVYNVDFGSYEILPENGLRMLPNSFRTLPLMSCYLKLNTTFNVERTVHDLEEKILSKVFRYFPSKFGKAILGVLLSCHDNNNNTPIVS